MAWINEVIRKLVDSVKAGFSDKITMIKQLSGVSSDLPSAEVWFSGIEPALEIRHKFIEKKRSGVDYG